MVRYLAFDLETTGTEPEADRIVEFCFIELDENLVEISRWTSLVDPQVSIPAETIAIHGITDEMVAGKPAFSHHAPRIQRLIQGTTFIGHNVRFDIQFLHHALQRAQHTGIRVDHPAIDTYELERIVNSHRLGACFKRYTGEVLGDAHRSEADTAATVEVLRRQRQIHKDVLPSNLAELEMNQLQTRENPQRARTWLDHGRRFYEDSKGEIRFGFGKYRDKLAKAEPDYLQWMLRQNFALEVNTIIQEILYGEVPR